MPNANGAPAIVLSARAGLIDLAQLANEEHRQCVAAFKSGLLHAITAGEYLLQAKAQVLHGEWLPWLAHNFEGSERIAREYMQVARADPDRLRVADLSFRDALRLLSEPRPLYAPVETPPLPDGVFRTIVADPAWDFENQWSNGAASKHYAVMPLADIIALPVAKIAAGNGHLYLWAPNGFVDPAHDVARAWGFEPKNVLTWIKPHMGLGAYFRNTTEFVLFCVRGSLPVLRHDMPTHFEAPCGRHSEKPERMFEIVESMSPGPYVELFARGHRPGWAAWGNEVPGCGAGRETSETARLGAERSALVGEAAK